MMRKTKIVRALLIVPVVTVLIVSIAGCGIVSDQTKQDAKKKIEAKSKQAKQEVKKKVEAKKQQAEQKVKKKVKTGRRIWRTR
jgi:sugar phosphate permease